jgi:hypothetical protein
MQAVFHRQQFFALALHHLGNRDAGGARHNLGDFLDADLRAQKLFRRRLASADFLRCGVRALQLRFELRQLAILQLGQFVELSFTLQFSHLHAQMINLFLDMRRALNLGLFSLPYFLQVVVFTRQSGDFLLDQRKPFFRRLIFFFLYCLSLDFQLNQAAFQLVHHLRF